VRSPTRLMLALLPQWLVRCGVLRHSRSRVAQHTASDGARWPDRRQTGLTNIRGPRVQRERESERARERENFIDNKEVTEGR
jgi:hypothetical protein